MLNRPSDNGHTPFGDIFLEREPGHGSLGMSSPRHVDEHRLAKHEDRRGPIPIETREGWLMFYHGVLTSCNGFVYSFGEALLDLEQPWKVIRRTHPYLLNPHEHMSAWAMFRMYASRARR